MKNRCQLSLQLRNPFGKPVSTKAAQWRNTWSSWKTWNAQNTRGTLGRLGTPRLLGRPHSEYLQYLGDLERSEYWDYYQSERVTFGPFCWPMSAYTPNRGRCLTHRTKIDVVRWRRPGQVAKITSADAISEIESRSGEKAQ